MGKFRLTIGFLIISLVTLTAISCKNDKNEKDIEPVSNEMGLENEYNQEASDEMTANNSGINVANAIINNYLEIKNALVEDNLEAAAKAGGNLIGNFDDFDKAPYSLEEREELTDIIEDAKEHAKHISESPIAHQREHFDILSKDVIDLIAITGTDKKLYQDFCPMFNDNKGAQWLSASEEIRNPYFGSKMIDCGKVEKVIN